MWRKLIRKIKGLFISEVRVLRPEIPLNRKQRRVQNALHRKRR